MLKWAINNPNRPTALHPSERRRSIASNSIQNGRRRSAAIHRSDHDRIELRRRSSGIEMTNIRRKILNRDKENNLTSTPLPIHRQSLSPLRKFDSLRDLSNIPPTPDSLSAANLQTPKSARISSAGRIKNDPLQYASTLPTFDVEYSPCSLVPGPILALRGIGIADTYFEKPRYLADETPGTEAKRSKLNPRTPNRCFPNASETRPANRHKVHAQTGLQIADESLSSSRMGDTTLDRMIDAILESARKERKLPKLRQHTQPVMSPTYTRAEDPASDLNEIWDPISERYQFNEREVRTPEDFDETIRKKSTPSAPPVEDPAMSCHLRRQRAVRRKRKLSRTAQNSTVSKEPAQAISRRNNSLFANSSLLRKSYDELVEMDTPKGCENSSPDSGRNSASDLEESAGEDNANSMRRRLTFSPRKAGM